VRVFEYEESAEFCFWS